jgi:serine/threonine protein kinase
MAEDPLELVGVTLDERFRVDSLVDDGELCLSYRALDLTRHVPVAVRCLNLPITLDMALAGPFVESFHERTKRHAQFGSGHPVFVKLLASGTTSVRTTGLVVPYEVREWLEATTLTAYIAKRHAKDSAGWSLDHVLAVLGPVADGLAYAHALGVTHGAVNPNTLVVVESGNRPVVRIADFGDAHREETGSLRPVLRVLVPEYTAPEQVDKELGAVGPWTDVFSLAVIVLECLAGTLGTQGRAASVLVEPENRPTPKKLGLTLPARIDEVLTRALSLEPQRRPADVATFWRELKAAAAPAPVPVKTVATVVLPNPPPRGPSKPPLPPRGPAKVNPLVKATLVGLQPQKASAPASPSLAGAAAVSSPAPAVAAPFFPPATLPPPSFAADEAPTRRRDALSEPKDLDEVRLSPPLPIEPFPSATGTGSFEEPDIFMPALGRPSIALKLRVATRRGREWTRDRGWPWVVARAKDETPRGRALFGASVFGGLVFLSLCMSLCLARSTPKPVSTALAVASAVASPTSPESSLATPPPLGGYPPPPPVASVPVDVPEVSQPSSAAVSAAPASVTFTRALANAALDTAGDDLSECKRLGTVRGNGSIRATFNKTGGVARISIGPPYADTPEGACILDRFGRAQMPPIRGNPGSVNYVFSLPK